MATRVVTCTRKEEVVVVVVVEEAEDNGIIEAEEASLTEVQC